MPFWLAGDNRSVFCWTLRPDRHFPLPCALIWRAVYSFSPHRGKARHARGSSAAPLLSPERDYYIYSSDDYLFNSCLLTLAASVAVAHGGGGGGCRSSGLMSARMLMDDRSSMATTGGSKSRTPFFRRRRKQILRAAEIGARCARLSMTHD